MSFCVCRLTWCECVSCSEQAGVEKSVSHPPSSLHVFLFHVGTKLWRGFVTQSYALGQLMKRGKVQGEVFWAFFLGLTRESTRDLGEPPPENFIRRYKSWQITWL